METKIRPRPVGRYAHKSFCRPLRWMLGLAFLSGVATAHAQAQDATSGAVPWVPSVITAIDQYVQDPAFRLSLDHFAAANTLDQQGLYTAQLANGNIVTAGLVPDGVAGGTCSDGTTLCSIGLVRYSQTGRVPWPNAGANGRYFNNYLVFPGGDPALRKYQYLRDVKVRDNYIDVLVDEPDPNHPALTLGHRNVRVVTFRDDGSLVGQFGIFGVAPNGGVESEDFYGAQMVQMNSTTMMVAATVYDSIGSYIAVTRLDILGNGALAPDLDWGVPYIHSSSFNSLIRYFAPTGYCGGSRCEVTAAFVAKQVGFAEQRDFYVAGSIHNAGADWDPIAVKISSIDGSQKAEFNTSGWKRVPFDDPGSNWDDRGAGLYVYQDDVYMAAYVSRLCRPGIGLARVNGATGSLISAFGTGGKIIFGGSATLLGGICATGVASSIPTAISATGGRIGIAGYQVRKSIFSNDLFYDPMLAVVDAVNGSVLSFDDYPVTRADGSRYGDATLSGIYGGNLGTSPFTVSGVGRDEGAGNTLSYLTGKLIPVSSDRIFANNFGNGDDH